MSLPTPGETHSVRRTFTAEDVERFTALSGDDQSIHTEPDEAGRYVVHGLLTATLPTVVGGDLDVLASHMAFDFHRPVYTGETVRCDWETTAVEPRDDATGAGSDTETASRAEITAEVTCVRVADGDESESATSDHGSGTDGGETVLTGRVEGVVSAE
ncbi:MaoC/PaaZ C-terminal domain-containing protein [Salinirubrum litoreum]|uniref:MaoC/PaaZ C-terminal domain-containing protein n=1 Tax=Salinirubrum litoreum TaxID=1126234 RepID=A0ABD5REU8_9EURY|nr:MaoC/PaaZ C-terminal domain-containing protein [Salinirubrum litoreum]